MHTFYCCNLPCCFCISHEPPLVYWTRYEGHISGMDLVSLQFSPTQLRHQLDTGEVLGTKPRLLSTSTNLGDVDWLAQYTAQGYCIA